MVNRVARIPLGQSGTVLHRSLRCALGQAFADHHLPPCGCICVRVLTLVDRTCSKASLSFHVNGCIISYLVFRRLHISLLLRDSNKDTLYIPGSLYSAVCRKSDTYLARRGVLGRKALAVLFSPWFPIDFLHRTANRKLPLSSDYNKAIQRKLEIMLLFLCSYSRNRFNQFARVQLILLSAESSIVCGLIPYVQATIKDIEH